MSSTAAGKPATVGAGQGMPRIARGGALNLLGAVITSITGVVLVIVVTRALPPSEAGIFFALTSLFLLAEMVARLGTSTGLVYFIARFRALGQTDRIRACQRVALIPVVVLSLAMAFVLAFWAPDFARLVGGGTGEGTRAAVLLLAVVLPVTTLSDTFLSATRGHATMLPTVVLDRITRPILQLGLVALAVTVGSVSLLAGAWALPWVLSAALAAGWLLRLQRGLPQSAGGTPGRTMWREFWTFTGPRAVSSLVQLALQRLDIILITVLIGPAQAAVYMAATRFLVVGQLTGTAISTAAQPRLAELLAVDDRTSARAVYQSATGWIVLLTWPLYLLCAVFADAVLTVFGSGYSAGRPVILVLAGAMLVATACGMVDMLLNMAGRTSWTLGNSILALAVMVTVDLWLIPSLGILGAGIGWAAAILVNNLLPLIQLTLSLGLHPFGQATWRAAALCGLCFGVLPAVVHLSAPGEPWPAVSAVLIGGVIFLAVCVCQRSTLALPPLRELRTRRRSTPAQPDLVQAPSGGVS